MSQVKVKTHLIITDIHEEFDMNWCGRIMGAKPLLKNNKPHFIIVGSEGRIEADTLDINYLERAAKSLTHPRGKEAITSDTARIYIRQEDDSDFLLGVLTHRTIKTFAPMYDTFNKI